MEYQEYVRRRIKEKLADPVQREEMLVDLFVKTETFNLIHEYRKALWMAEDYELKSKSLWLRLKEKFGDK